MNSLERAGVGFRKGLEWAFNWLEKIRMGWGWVLKSYNGQSNNMKR